MRKTIKAWMSGRAHREERGPEAEWSSHNGLLSFRGVALALIYWSHVIKARVFVVREDEQEGLHKVRSSLKKRDYFIVGRALFIERVNAHFTGTYEDFSRRNVFLPPVYRTAAHYGITDDNSSKITAILKEIDEHKKEWPIIIAADEVDWSYLDANPYFIEHSSKLPRFGNGPGITTKFYLNRNAHELFLFRLRASTKSKVYDVSPNPQWKVKNPEKFSASSW